MGAINYVARREMEATGFSVAGSDISAAASDDSFNATIVDLAGLLADQWVEVRGFANAENNGWFQASIDSVTGKITLQGAALVDEAAGASVTIIGYYRGQFQSYDIETDFVQSDRSVAVMRSVRQPLGGGAPEILLHRNENTMALTSGPITLDEIKQWREFLASVEGGESFTVDAMGTVAVPDEVLSVIMASEGYTEQRDGTLRQFTISFNVRIL